MRKDIKYLKIFRYMRIQSIYLKESKCIKISEREAIKFYCSDSTLCKKVYMYSFYVLF